MAHHCSATWFAGKISKEQADEKVKQGQPGSYLVRQSVSSNDKFFVVVSDGGVPVSFIIDRKASKFFFAGTSSDSLEEVVAFLRTKAMPSRLKKGAIIRLQHPIQCQAAPSQTASPVRRPSNADRRALLEKARGGGKLGTAAGSSRSPTKRPTDQDRAQLAAAAERAIDGTGKAATARPRGPSNAVASAHQAPRNMRSNSVSTSPSGATKKRAPSLQDKQALLDKARMLGAGEEAKSAKSPQVLVPDDEAEMETESKGGFTSEHKSLELFIAPLDVAAFEALSVHQTLPSELPDVFKGKTKNRFFDILPNPTTRVKLPFLRPPPGIEVNLGSSYVNANFVRGYGGRSARSYIAAQAPLPSTVYNFVRMIWTYRVSCIVMTTGLMEGGKIKCERYWPDSPKSPPIRFAPMDGMGPTFYIALRKVETIPGTKIHYLRVSDGKRIREVRHFWYFAWPDHGVPTNSKGEVHPNDVINLMETVSIVQRQLDGGKSPLLVHCSAGVGRTGTFIVIDHVMQGIKNQDEVDLVEIISQLREDRMLLVQHTAQYKFAFQACITYARRHVADTSGGGIYDVASQYTEEEATKSSQEVKVRQHWRPKAARGVSVYELFKDAATTLTEAEAKRNDDEEDPVRRLSSDTGDLPEEVLPLSQQPWFRHAFSRPQVIEMLQDAAAGTFVVRDSPQHKNLYILSVKSPSNNIVHVRLMPVPDAQTKKIRFKMGPRGERSFPSILDLVKCFAKESELIDQNTGVKFSLLMDAGDAAIDSRNTGTPDDIIYESFSQPSEAQSPPDLSSDTNIKGDVIYESFVEPSAEPVEDVSTIYSAVKKRENQTVVPDVYGSAHSPEAARKPLPPLPQRAQHAPLQPSVYSSGSDYAVAEIHTTSAPRESNYAVAETHEDSDPEGFDDGEELEF